MPNKKHRSDRQLRIAFGTHLRMLIRERDLSLRGFADTADIEYSQIARITGGLTSPSITTLYKIAETLGISLKDLFDFEYPTSVKNSRPKH